MKVIHQSVFEKWQIEDNSVQSIITSPPYFSLRKYNIPDVVIGEWKGQHGLEPDFKLYLSHCKLWMQEAVRVLKDDGVIFINLGDSFSSVSGGMAHGVGVIKQTKQQGYPQKSKLLIPERFAIMCVDELGLILRNHIVWSKPNGMPESCTDRFSKKWESVFMFTKQPKYYFNLDAIREPHAQVSIDRLQGGVSINNKWVNGADGQTPQGLNQPRPNIKYITTGKQEGEKQKEGNSSFGVYRPYTERKLRIDGKNPGDVWNIPTMPSSEKHFAMYPEKLVKKMLLCSTKPNDIVLDPFCGSGTTLRVAEKYNRIGIGIDLGYKDIQSRRLKNIQKEINFS